mgnify:CR=1 FL=1
MRSNRHGKQSVAARVANACGRPRAALRSVGGKAMLAAMPDAMVEEYLARVVFERITDKTITIEGRTSQRHCEGAQAGICLFVGGVHTWNLRDRRRDLVRVFVPTRGAGARHHRRSVSVPKRRNAESVRSRLPRSAFAAVIRPDASRGIPDSRVSVRSVPHRPGCWLGTPRSSRRDRKHPSSEWTRSAG